MRPPHTSHARHSLVAYPWPSLVSLSVDHYVRSRMPAIAFLGLGHMGSPMAHRLVAAGHDVTVWNRTEARTRPLVDAGATAAATPASAVASAEVVITMLADPAA